MAPKLTIQNIWKSISMLKLKLKLFIHEWLMRLLETLRLILMSFQVQYMVLLTYWSNKEQTLSGLILILVSESRNTVEKVRNRWLGRLKRASLLGISNHCLWLGFVLQSWYPFNAKWLSRKSRLQSISLYTIVYGFLFYSE